MRALLILLFLVGSLNAESKIALLIGNSNYMKKRLDNPKNDVDLLESKLKEIGFTVYNKKDLSKSQMISELKKFYQKIDKETIALIYFSGHGVNSTLDQKNYLIPIGAFSALFNEGQLPDLAISDNYLLNSTAGAKFSILLLDACRSNDFKKFRGNKGLGLPQPILNNDYVISYATKIGKTAEDGISNSPYALALSKYLNSSYSISDMFTKIRKDVSSRTNGKQEPYYISETNSIFYLNKKNSSTEITKNIIYGFLPKNPNFPHGKGITRKKGKCNEYDTGCITGLSFPSFNNYLDSGTEEGVQDERTFLVTKNMTQNSKKTHFTTCIPGDEIYVQAYIHNNGNGDIKNIAHNVKLGIVGFTDIGNGVYQSNSGYSIPLRYFIESTNSIPNKISDTAIITSKHGRKIKLQFQSGIDILSTTKGHTINPKFFFKEGMNIGDIKGGDTSNSFYSRMTLLVVDASETKIKAKCSPINSRNFSKSEQNYSTQENSAFCEKGIVNNPKKILFPSIDSSITWECHEIGTNFSVSCVATRK